MLMLMLVMRRLLEVRRGGGKGEAVLLPPAQ